MTLLYTPGQLRSAVSIKPETYRHWKKTLDPLQRARGHSPCFTSGDLVAISVIRCLTVDTAIRVGALGPIAESLFELCNASPWPVLERTKVIVDVAGAELQLVSELALTTSEKPLVSIPLGPLIFRLRDQLLAATVEEDQPSLRFPPVSLAQAANQGARS